MDELRFKDLRHQTAIHAQRASIPQVVSMRALGHSSDKRTRQYQRYEAVMSIEQVAALEAELLPAPAPRQEQAATG